jgi:hypothetical protein
VSQIGDIFPYLRKTLDEAIASEGEGESSVESAKVLIDQFTIVDHIYLELLIKAQNYRQVNNKYYKVDSMSIG